MVKYGNIKLVLQKDEFWKLDKKVKVIIMEKINQQSREKIIKGDSFWKINSNNFIF